MLACKLYLFHQTFLTAIDSFFLKLKNSKYKWKYWKIASSVDLIVDKLKIKVNIFIK